jgi:tetratricopeptide (TPR) repeat protein
VKNRFIKGRFPLFLCLAILFISGCATSPDRSKPPPSSPALKGQESGKDPFSGLPERYRVKARAYEKRGDLPNALRSWEVVKSFVPGDAEAERKVAQLEKQIPAVADQHFHKGVAFFNTHSYALARKEFLSALYLNPDQAEAIQYLKERLAGNDFLTYEVKKGDTLKEVARKVYEDPQKDFLIAYFNGLRVEGPLEPPLLLRMPVLAPPPVKKTSAPAKSEAEYKFEMTLDPQEVPERAGGTDREKKHQESTALAEAHYLKGVNFFVEEQIEKAIQEWETTLSLEPKHPKAKKDIETARNLLQKLEKIK